MIQKIILNAINLLLIAVIIYFSVAAVYKKASGYYEIDIHNVKFSNQDKPVENKLLQSLSTYNAFVKRDLFKVKKVKKAPKKIVALKETRLNLKLWGTVEGPDEKAFAIIEDGRTRVQNLYHIGDTIQQANVKKIVRNKVVLNVKGTDEILEMEDLSNGKGKGRTRSPSGRSRRYGKPQRNSSSKTQQMTINRSKINNAVQNINELMKQARIRPHFSKGVSDGIRISGIRRGSIFSEIGLKSGDIISSVNGKKIESVDDALTLYSSFKSNSKVDLQLKRRGINRTIRYNIKD